MIKINQEEARQMMLLAQGLESPPEKPAAIQDIRRIIQNLGAVQIDTIHVVARSPYFTLWSRAGDYPPVWLETLLAEGAIFEYWSHAASFLPVEDYPLYRRRMLEVAADEKHRSTRWLKEHSGVAAAVLEKINNQGAVRSLDFPREEKKTSGWWNWSDQKMALEQLFYVGELMIARREKFHRIYDLRQRVLPGWDDAHAPSLAGMKAGLIEKTVRCLGIARPKWVPDYFRLHKNGSSRLLQTLAAEDKLVRLEVEGWEDGAYLHPQHLDLLDGVQSGERRSTVTTILSPFDPLVWDRARLKEAFQFEFSLECYLPEAKRKYGYFSLPVLHQGRFVGRLDAKARRKEGVFEVKKFFLEPGVAVTADLVEALRSALAACAAWHGTLQVVVRWSDPPELAASLSGGRNL